MNKKNVTGPVSFAVILALCITCCAGCGSKDEPASIHNVTVETSGTTAQLLAEEGMTEDDVTLPMYPRRDNKSYFMQFVMEAPEEVLMQYDASDSEPYAQYVGRPYYIEGTVIKTVSALEDILPYEQDDLAIIGDSRAYMVDVDGTEVTVIDFLPAYINLRKQQAGDDVQALAVYKLLYDNLKPYDDHPEVGDTVRIYGFYADFWSYLNRPTFIYGLSKLTYNMQFGALTPDLTSTGTVRDRYLNYADFDKPEYWSNMKESSSSHAYYFDTGNMVWQLSDNEADAPLSSFVDEAFADLDGEPGLTVLSREYTTIGDGSIDAFRLRISYLVSEAGDSITEDIIVFCHKHMYIIVDFFDSATDDATARFNQECFDRLVGSITLRKS